MKVHHVMRIDGSIQTIAYNNYTLRLTSGSYVSKSSVRRAACILAIASGTYRWTGMQCRQTYREKERTMVDLLSLLLELILILKFKYLLLTFKLS